MNYLRKNFAYFAWLLSLIVALVAFGIWSKDNEWQFSDLSTYRIFPIFGMLAFSWMWSMYAVGFFRRRLAIDAAQLKLYYQIMPLVILGALLLHPGLLIWQLWRDGFGLPPSSYLQHYVAPSVRWALYLSTTVWLIFIAYELRYKFRGRSWWKYMEYIADAALLAIFFHPLVLGHEVRHTWFRYVWFFYGITLLLVLLDQYAVPRLSKRKKLAKKTT